MGRMKSTWEHWPNWKEQRSLNLPPRQQKSQERLLQGLGGPDYKSHEELPCLIPYEAVLYVAVHLQVANSWTGHRTVHRMHVSTPDSALSSYFRFTERDAVLITHILCLLIWYTLRAIRRIHFCFILLTVRDVTYTW